ncbi:MAG: hypothetical protein WBA93_10450 [Microcoleaceae cyanobacterium]
MKSYVIIESGYLVKNSLDSLKLLCYKFRAYFSLKSSWLATKENQSLMVEKYSMGKV